MEKLYPSLKIAELIAKERKGVLTDSESLELQGWLFENEQNKRLYDKIKDNKRFAENFNELRNINTQKAYKNVLNSIALKNSQRKILGFNSNIVKYAAAIALLVVSVYFIVSDFNKQDTLIAQSNIVPGTQKAILITSNNRQIFLDSTSSGQIITNDAASILQNGTGLTYQKNNSITDASETKYNTLITPMGGEYNLVLSDGTKIILNAGSRLTYPVVFKGNLREVTLDGEAFFNVAKAHNKPFIVNATNLNITVYGTSFNVLAYKDENFMQTTLVEGNVGITDRSKPGIKTRIQPGQQFLYDKNTGNTVTKEVDTDKYIAWTKGLFVFENEPIGNILNTMARWYNFNVEFQNVNLKKERFTLSVGRSENVTKILDMIATSSGLKFIVKADAIEVYSE